MILTALHRLRNRLKTLWLPKTAVQIQMTFTQTIFTLQTAAKYDIIILRYNYYYSCGMYQQLVSNAAIVACIYTSTTIYG